MIDGQQASPDVLDLEDISPGRSLRKFVNASKFLIRLFSPDFETRISGVKKSGDPPFLSEALPSLKEIAENPKEDDKIRWTAKESIALIGFGSDSVDSEAIDSQLASLKELEELKSLRALARIESFKKKVEELRQSGVLSAK